MTHPYDTDSREPLVIWLTRAALWIAGGDPLGPRLLTSMLFPILALQLFRLSFAVVPRLEVACASAGLFLANPNMLSLARSGTRDTYFLVGLLLLAQLAITPREKMSPERWAAALALGCIGTVAIRITSLPPVIVLVAYTMLRNRLRPRLLVPALLSLSLVLGPYLAYCERHYGDAFRSANIHAVWWRNYEFVTLNGAGCDGCPTAEELATDPYAGSPTSMFHYVFRMRSMRELAQQSIQGAFQLFVNPYSEYFQYFLGVHHRDTPGGKVLGYLLLAFPAYVGVVSPLPGRRRVVFLVPLLLINVSIFTAVLDMPPRIFSATAPIAAMTWGVGCGQLARAWARLAGVDPSQLARLVTTPATT